MRAKLGRPDIDRYRAPRRAGCRTRTARRSAGSLSPPVLERDRAALAERDGVALHLPKLWQREDPRS